MNNSLIIPSIYLAGIALLLILNELAYQKFKITGELTRKFAHFASIISTIPFPYIFTSHWHVLSLAILFAAILFVSRNGKYLNSIHDIKRKSVGSYLLPLSIYVTFLISTFVENKLLYILPMLILSICDPIAALMGINIKSFNNKIAIGGQKLDKTWIGSGAFLVTSFIVSITSLYFHCRLLNSDTFYLAILIAFVTMFAELLSSRGVDNLSIPLSAVLVLAFYF